MRKVDYKVLYRKYRPDNFSNIIGQDYITTILKNAIASNHISHAYIFSGPRGTGKTSTAKVFAKTINCLNPGENGPCNECESCQHFKENADIIEIDAASNNGVDEIREIINNIKLAPSYSKYKVYIIDEVHMLSTSAFNALLLTLEEPPKHVIFILATTNIEAVPVTILSRCQRFDFHKISNNDIITRLKYVVNEEKITIDDEAIEEVAYISDGGMRDALSILDQLASNASQITIKDVEEHFGSISKKQVSDLYDLINENNVDKFVETMKKFKNLAIDYKILIKKLLEKIEDEAIKRKKEHFYDGIMSYENLKNLAYDLASISNYINLNVDPYLLIEITMLNYFPGNNSSRKESNSNENKESTTFNNDIAEIATDIPKETTTEAKEDVHLEEKMINIRINNCFVNAKKEFLQDLKIKWQEFLKNISDKNLLSVIIDTIPIAASDRYAIISCSLDGTANLLNSKIKEIEKEYNHAMNASYRFIAISKNRWDIEKEKYIENLKNHYTYNYQEEIFEYKPNIANEEYSKDNNIENIALNIFDKGKIEIE